MIKRMLLFIALAATVGTTLPNRAVADPCLSGRITALKQDNDFHSFGLYPILQPAKLELKLVQMLFIFLALHLLGIRIVSRHASHLCIWTN